MRNLIVLAALCGTLLLPARAMALPGAFYDPATGNLRLWNDRGQVLAAIVVISLSGDKMVSNPAAYATIPSPAIFDPGDLPLAFTYLNYPSTGPTRASAITIGNVVVPGTPISDLSGFYYDRLGQVDLTFVTPEPTTATLMGVWLIAMARGLRRRA